jgi:hypothetical protein
MKATPNHWFKDVKIYSKNKIKKYVLIIKKALIYDANGQLHYPNRFWH